MARSPSPENIMDLIAKPAAKSVPETRYVSRYRDKIRRAAKRGKSAHKTFGVPSVALNPPGEFLRKRSSSLPKRPEVHHEHYHKPGYQHKLPDWQPIKASEKDREASRSRVDFTKRNIEEAKNLRPLKPRKYYVDDRHGTVHALKTSGLYPTYRNRKSYGQVPGRNSSTTERPEPRQMHGGQSPRLEHKTKSERYENKREINSPGQNERNRHVAKSSGKHVEKRDRHDAKSPGKHEEKRERRETKSPRKEGEKRNTHRSKDTKKHERKNGDGDKDVNYDENGEETDSDRKYDAVDREESREAIEIKSLRSAEAARKRVTHNERDDDLASRASVQQPRCRYVTEDEREELLYGMKKKWDEMMKKFQCLPFLTDTPPKAKRKSAMEKDLLQLEKDINIIERHPYIYVYSDSDDEC